MEVNLYAVIIALLIGLILGFIAGRQALDQSPGGASGSRPPKDHSIRAFVALLNDVMREQEITPLTQEQTGVLQAMIEKMVRS